MQKQHLLNRISDLRKTTTWALHRRLQCPCRWEDTSGIFRFLRVAHEALGLSIEEPKPKRQLNSDTELVRLDMHPTSFRQTCDLLEIWLKQRSYNALDMTSPNVTVFVAALFDDEACARAKLGTATIGQHSAITNRRGRVLRGKRAGLAVTSVPDGISFS